jgi:signal transduction histidine kinase
MNERALRGQGAAAAALALAGLALGWLAYRTQVDDLLTTTEVRSATSVAAGAAFLVAGLVAWLKRPGNRLGPLMLAVGFAALARQLRYSEDPAVFTIFFLLGELPYALFVHTVLAYPSGHVTGRAERAFVRAAYGVALAFPLAILLTYDGTHTLRYYDPRPRESLLHVAGDAKVVHFLQDTYAVVGYGAVASAFIVLVLRKLWLATPRARRFAAPLLLVGGVVAALRAVFDGVVTFAGARPPAFVVDRLFWWQIAGLIAVPAFLLVGLLRAHLSRLTVAGLVVDLEDAPPHRIRDALADALGDPTLEVAFWLPERHEFVDAEGRTLALPTGVRTRAITRLEHDGRPLAVLIHDVSLLEEPELVESAGAAARLALENARLHAEVQAQLAKVKASRARIVAAADEQRRRLERDLHDGAQQRLVALALELRRAHRRLGPDADPELARLLAGAAEELHVAVQELRELAGGILPPVLAQSGLAAALQALANRAPLPVTVGGVPERLPPELEVTAYFVVSEALANVVKHARASRASIAVTRRNGSLVVEVADDGVGGADADGDGSGLRGLADRVEALGGRLVVDSPTGEGTRVIGELPCAS